MISQLKGKILRKSPTEIVVDVNGVGYLVNIPLSTSEKIDSVGSDVTLLTHLHIREDAMILFGFFTEAEREIFHLLISISGIGPKIALAILSGITPENLREAVQQGAIEAFTSIAGVGRKTGERIILELRNKFGKIDISAFTETPTSQQLKLRSEAIVALMSLGYNRASAEQVIRAVINESIDKDLSVEEIIKKALHHSSKQR
jgi:holliday junction DNA helicase RuvA